MDDVVRAQPSTQSYIGQPLRRREDERFITGRGQYLDDIRLPGMLHATILRSPHAHAHVRGIDVSAALALDGVTAVFTHADMADLLKPIPMRVFPLPGLDDYLQTPLSADTVRHAGEAVAVVVAESRYIAEDALDLVEVDYEALPAVTTIDEALKDAVLVHPANGTNLAGSAEINVGDVEAAFRDAEYVRREQFSTNRHTANPMETRGLVASYDSPESSFPNEEGGDGHMRVWGPTKVSHTNRAILARHLEIDEERIHFIEPDVGGGFGVRGEFYAEDFLIPFASFKLGRPVKWVEDRAEHLSAANHSREVQCEVEIAARNDGTLLGLRTTVYGDMGAYVRTHGSVVPALTAVMMTGPYRIPNFRASVNCVMTNKMGAGTYRAPGFFEGTFIRERLLDMMAGDLGLDPAELRRRNLISASEMPYNAGPTRLDGRNTVFDSGDYASAFNRALEQVGYDQLANRKGPDDRGRYHGVGIASYVEPTGFGPFEGARVLVTPEGGVEVYLGITTMGQGHETVMAQICADSLSVPFEDVRIFHGSTDYIPASIGTFGSRASVMAGSAIHLSCQTLRARILSLAASYLDTQPEALDLRHGVVSARDGGTEGRTLSLQEVAALAESQRRFDDTSAGSGETALDATEYFRIEEWTYSYGSHAAHVAMDPETGKLEVLRYVVVEDVGRCINPLTMHGQSVGGAAQGIGGALLEELVYDEGGQLLSGTLMDYLLPTSTDVPNIETVITEEAPSPLNPLGIKGAGEGAILATGAALGNAVAHALSPFGVHITSLPLSPGNVLRWIAEGKERLTQTG